MEHLSFLVNIHS